jgi:two-component system sensor histidine kinase MtrB
MTDAAANTAPLGRSVRLRRMARARFEFWERLGLRARVTFLFAFGALLLSILMGSLAFYTTSHFLVSDNVNTAIDYARTSAVTVEAGLRQTKNPPPDYQGLLLSSVASANTTTLLSDNGFFSSSLTIFINDLPQQLVALVSSGTPAMQNVVIHDHPQVAVGIPLPGLNAQYYVVVDLHDLDHTLHILAFALVLGGLVTTLLGGLIGRLASGRTLRPLSAVSRAAVAIAGGDLDTRLRATSEDPDLIGLTQSFNAMVDQLQDRIERDARFASDVSHELRSPLTTISNTVNVLESHAEELSPRAREALALLAADVRRLERMVTELLEMARSDTGATEVSLEYVDAGELVRRTVAAGARSLPDSVVPPTVWVDPLLDDVLLHVDKRRFERVMTNLLENAANYGGGAIRVAAEPGPDRAGRPTVVVAVEDQGPGVPESERRRIFERFYRGQASGRRGTSLGTGLGLALVAEHVRLLGGHVDIEDAPGGGARFTVELPALDGDDPS